MFLSLLVLATLVGMVTMDPTPPPTGERADAGFRGFGRFVGVVTIVGALLLGVVIVLGLLSVFGVFVHETADPPV